LEDSKLLKERYKIELLKWNKHINLISRKNTEQVFEDLYKRAEGILSNKGIKKILDIGSGNGFPAVALKIMNSNLDIILLEPREKRYHFLVHISLTLDFTNNFRIFCIRWEDFDLPTGWKPDLIVSQGLKLPPECLKKFMP
jgi:16S rRNA (guanine527-N7)-methyltransferase